ITAAESLTGGSFLDVISSEPESSEIFEGGIVTYSEQIKHHVLKVSTETLEKQDRKSTRLNSSHVSISYAVFCLKKKKNKYNTIQDRSHDDHGGDEHHGVDPTVQCG